MLEAVRVFAGVLSLIWWFRQNSTQAFNPSILGAYAYYSGIALLVAGVILLFWKRPHSWGIGVTMLVVLFSGYLAQYLIHQPAGDYAWFVRLGEMFGYILLLELPRRLVTDTKDSQIAEGEILSPPFPSRMDEKILHTIINLINEKSPQQFYQKLARLVAQIMDAEICLIVIPPKTGAQRIVPMGYCLQDERVIDGFTADAQKMPLLLDAIQTGKTLRIDGSGSASEVHILTGEFRLNQNAHLLVVPFKPKDAGTEMGILVLSKPAHPMWSEAEEAQLLDVVSGVASMIPEPGDKTIQAEIQAETQVALQHVQEELDN